MIDADSFLRVIAAEPENDAARLVYADWLDEHGEADRAEFIRLQCGPDRDRPATVRRADELHRDHGKQWEAPFRTLKAEVHFRRGFPYFLKADLHRLVENLSLLSLAPEWHLILERQDY